jgi:acetylornithine deacetylase/succinyl-diaminopimelate desuccinylase-like protein
VRPMAAALAALLAAGGSAGAAGAQRPGGEVVRQAARTYRAAHEVEILREFADLLAIPNLASDSENIRRNAERVSALLALRGVSTELLESPGAPPVVYGELKAPGARRTVVLYAHYDGQPVDPAKWTGKPWQPVLRDGPVEAGGRDVPWDAVKAPVNPEWLLYARSAGDDKAPVIGLALALDALRAAKLPLSVNLKFFIEGEEEAGSPHLPAFLDRYRDRLQADSWLLFDGPVHPSRRMQVFFGARGIAGVTMTAYGPIRRLHSGHYGNWAPNPIAELARLVAGLRDDRGNILIKGFSSDVRPVTDTERRALAAAPDVDGALEDELALGRTEGPDGEHILDTLMRPALNLRGFSGGDVGEKTTNSIPTEATASIDFRLVPDQTPEGVRAKVEAHLQALGYTLVRETPDRATRRKTPRLLKVTWEPGYPSARTSMDLPVSRAVSRVISESFGYSVVELPTLGGSVPMYLFTDVLKTPVVGVPIANHDDNQHSSNENIRLQNLWDGIETCAALLARLDW